MYTNPPAMPEVFCFVRMAIPAPLWDCIAKSKYILKGGDRVDADGIPLYFNSRWQKARFWSQVCSGFPRITNFFPE
jgi:hypothetical protein